MASDITTIIPWALLGGAVPTMVWLIIWLSYDEHPEPLPYIILSFIAGALITLLVIPIQQQLDTIITNDIWSIVAVASVEEILKFTAVGSLVIAAQRIDEPIDYVMYLVTGGLGFAAFENTLFLLNPELYTDLGLFLSTSNIRFAGATAVHALAGGVMGLFMGWGFYKPFITREILMILGVAIACGLHAAFNFFIITSNESYITAIIGVVWVVTIICMVLLKTIRYRSIRR